ncbi:MAG: hypothetical protein H6574_11685 [Lewinellaceae bacterium]|nr:hypothetical protein [Saprospiraceae bacterium]MCB9331737.1 hypothetical protein [Lewinellaceae bacterium]
MKQPTVSFNTRMPLFGILFLLGAAQLPAQDLHVYYNLFTDSLSYKKDGEAVKRPKIRKGDFIILHFTEYNPYLYEADVDIDQRNTDDWDGGASTGTLGLAPGMGSRMAIASGADESAPNLFSFMDMPLFNLGGTSLQLRDFFSGSNSRGETAVQLEKANAKLVALAKIQSEMVEIYSELQTMEKAERAAQLAAEHLDQLLHNPRIRPSLIRRIAQEYQSMIFPNQSDEALALNEAFKWQERPVVKRRLMNQLEAKQREFDTQIIQLSPITQQLSNLDAGSTELEDFTADLRDVTGNAGNLREQLEAYLAYQNDKSTRDLTVEEMMALQLKFRELSDQSFSYDVAISMEKNNVITTARFSPHDSVSTSAKDQAIATKVKTVKLSAQGGLRISTGFGVGFSRLFEPDQEFSTRDNAIVADESGIVQPALSTYIHFYPGNRSGVGFAGTFGIGIPLSTANLTSLNFFLGPSLLFGRGQRIVLSGGLTAGPSTRLGKGFNVGDYFDPNAGDIPTRTSYDLGYFLGISFNIGG